MKRMGLIAVLVVVAGAWAVTQAQLAGAEAAAVKLAIENHYFKAQVTGVGDHLKGTFVPEGRMMWVDNGALRQRTSEEYLAGFTGKPAADEAQRTRRVVLVDATGDAAVAKVELDFPTVLFTDYFSLLKIGGEWKIVHKAFHRQAKTAATGAMK
jgi:hypothetical protein